MIEIEPRDGMSQLAKMVIAASLKDLAPHNSYAKRREAVMFFQSGERFSLMCDLGELDEDAIIDEYKQILRKYPLVEPTQGTKNQKIRIPNIPDWYRKGKVGVYRDSQLVCVLDSVRQAATYAGVTTPSVYSSIRTGKPVAGLIFRKRLSLQRSGEYGSLRIGVYRGGKKIGIANGYTQASEMTSLSWHTVMRYIGSGRTTREGFVFKREGMRG